MNLSIIIVSWNVREKLKDNLRSIFANKFVDFEVIVVDNNSHDKTPEMVKKFYPQVKLNANKENLGFAKACNQGVRQASGQYLLLLNPDMKVFDDTFSNMISWMNHHEKAWVAGCKLIDENSKIITNVRRFPTIFDQLAIIFKIPHLLDGVLNKYLRLDFDYSKSSPVDSIRGGFFLMRSNTIKKIGPLDERYFLWFEEVDYCKRVKSAGGEVWYSNAAECIDLVGQSFKQLNRVQAQKYFRESMLRYFKKWHSPLSYWILKLAWPIGLGLTWIGEKLNFKNKAET